MNSLSFDKQLTHSIFCQQIQGIEIENAKQLLVALHLAYLWQQSMFTDLIVPDTFNDMN